MHFRSDNEDYNPHADFPPGLVGDIAQYIYDASYRPIREVALVSALGLMAGLCGSAYNVSETGLNIYLMLLAPSGRGKETVSQSIERLIGAASTIEPKAANFVGPQELEHRSIFAQFGVSPSFVSVFAEWGVRMRKLSAISSRASDASLKATLLAAYSKSGRRDVMRGPTNQIVQSPAMSIVGESVAEVALKNLPDSFVIGGLLSRFSVIDYKGGRVPPNYERPSEPPPELVQRIASLATSASMLVANERHGLKVNISPEAMEHFTAFDEACEGLSDHDAVSGAIWARSHLKALKFAALVAVGENPTHPVISHEVATWASEYEYRAANSILQHLGGGFSPAHRKIVGRRNACRRVMRDFECWAETKLSYNQRHMRRDGLIPLDFIVENARGRKEFRRTYPRGTSEDIKAILDSMVKRHELIQVSGEAFKAKYNTSMYCAYQAVNIELEPLPDPKAKPGRVIPLQTRPSL